eukprot:9935915-Heterocapsa_arctica.AAC.1
MTSMMRRSMRAIGKPPESLSNRTRAGNGSSGAGNGIALPTLHRLLQHHIQSYNINGLPRGRYREKDEVTVPAFPTRPQLSQWRIQIGKNLAAPSGRWDQEELGWFIVRGHGPGIDYDTLADSGEERFRSLDIKLSASLGKV